MARLLGLDVLGQRVLKTQVVEVPEWGGEVLLRELTSEEMAELQEIAAKAIDTETRLVRDGKAMIRFRATAVFFAWVDEAGKRVMGREDIGRLLQESYVVLDRLADVVEEMSGMNQAALALAKKNSEKTRSGDSGSS